MSFQFCHKCINGLNLYLSEFIRIIREGTSIYVRVRHSMKTKEYAHVDTPIFVCFGQSHKQLEVAVAFSFSFSV